MDPHAKAQAALDSMKVDEICMNGKTLPVFTEKNLESMGKEQLKSRGLDLKDLLRSLGAENVSMPRHPESLREWILATQQTLLRAGQGGPPGGPGGPGGMQGMQGPVGMSPYRDGGLRSGGPPPPVQPASGRPAYEPSEAATEADEAYMSARAGAMANRQRNMGGSTNILTWQ